MCFQNKTEMILIIMCLSRFLFCSVMSTADMFNQHGRTVRMHYSETLLLRWDDPVRCSSNLEFVFHSNVD